MEVLTEAMIAGSTVGLLANGSVGTLTTSPWADRSLVGVTAGT